MSAPWSSTLGRVVLVAILVAILVAAMAGCAGGRAPLDSAAPEGGSVWDAGVPDGAEVGTDVADDRVAADAGADILAPTTVEEACAAINRAQAEFSVRCFGGPPADWETFVASQLNCTTLARHVREGSAEYRPQEWTNCMREYAAPCEAARSEMCPWSAMPGKVADGQPCSDSLVCGIDAGCVSLGDDQCASMCVRPGRESEACGFYCGGATPCLEASVCGVGLLCRGGTCTKPSGSCDPADGRAACASGFSCAHYDEITLRGICSPSSSVRGGGCQHSDHCVPGEFCLLGICTPRKAAGEACANVADGGCAAWTRCDPDNSRCVPAGHPGERCSPLYGILAAVFCTEGVCADDRCERERPAGAMCGASCEPGSSCNLTTARCEACPR